MHREDQAKGSDKMPEQIDAIQQYTKRVDKLGESCVP